MPMLYPNGGTAEIGARSWQVEWWTIRPASAAKDRDDIDFDSDLDNSVARFTTRAAALRKGKAVAPKAFFGAATVQEQVCEPFVDGLAEWNDVGQSEEVIRD